MSLPVQVDLKTVLEKVIIELSLEVGGRSWVDSCGTVCPALLSCDSQLCGSVLRELPGSQMALPLSPQYHIAL